VLGMAVAVGISAVTGRTTSLQSTAVSHEGAREAMHIHPHLEVMVNGNPILIPVNIGISPSLYKDHSLDQYGGMHGMAPLHTHGDDGTIHVESNVVRNYTLGEFLDIWGGLDIAGKRVKMTVDGDAEPLSDFRNHVFRDGEQIILAIEF
jgi:hypothetical protein